MENSSDNLLAQWEKLKTVASLADLKSSVRSTEDIPFPRSIAWKALLLFEDAEIKTWSSRQQSLRGVYQSLREHFVKDQDEASAGTDPLSSDYDAVQSTLHKEEELRREIYQDVERCMPDMTYYNDPEIMRLMCDILLVYSKLNPDLGYRQGMHELLAPVIWAVDHTSMQESTESDETLTVLLDRKYIEHDAFSIFAKVMLLVKPYYEWTPQKTDTPLIVTCNRIWAQLLPLYDPELADHLVGCDISPQIFLLKWIRLLFSREFSFDNTLLLWDQLFAEEQPFDLIEYICVAMLLRIRWQLLEDDGNGALRLLLHYPAEKAVQSLRSLVDDACFLRRQQTVNTGREVIHRTSGRRPAEYMTASKLEPSVTFENGSPNARRVLLDVAARSQLGQTAQQLFNSVPSRNLNRFVQNALSEVQKNVQSMSPPRPATPTNRRFGRRSDSQAAQERNLKIAAVLASALEDAQECEKALTTDGADGKATAAHAALRRVALQIQAAHSCLVDSSLAMPDLTSLSIDVSRAASGQPSTKSRRRSSVAQPARPVTKEPIKPAGGTEKPTIQLPLDNGNQASSIAEKGTSAEPPVQGHSITSSEDMNADNTLRPSMTQSSYSFLLDQVHQGPFSTASTLAPTEKRRQRHSREKSFLFGEEVDLNDPLQDKP